MTLAMAYVVRIATSAASTHAAEPTGATTDHCAEKIGIGGIVASGKLLIVRQFCLDQIKLLLTDNRGNLGHRGPLLLGGLGMSSPASANGNERRVPPTCLSRTTSPNVNCSCVDGIGENASNGCLVPPRSSTRTRDAQIHEVLGHGL